MDRGINCFYFCVKGESDREHNTYNIMMGGFRNVIRGCVAHKLYFCYYVDGVHFTTVWINVHKLHIITYFFFEPQLTPLSKKY